MNLAPLIPNGLFQLRIATILVFSLLTACSSMPPDTTDSANEHLGETSVATNFLLPSRVAVLPFSNETSNPEAATQVRRIFYNYFSSLNYRDAEIYTVDEAVKEQIELANLAPGEELPWKNICQKLNVDGFITGTVHDYGKMYAVLYSQTAVSIGVQFRSCENGSFIWQQEVEGTKRDGDLPLSPTGLAAAIVTTYFRHQDMSALEVAAKLSMDLTLTMPNPPSLLAVPPKINFFLHNGSGRLLLPGQQLKVVMRGAARANAYWSIPGITSRLPMQEKEPGTYIGEYEVQPNDQALDAQLVGYLISAENAETLWIDILEPVSLGAPTVLPSVITTDMTLTPKKSPYLISEIVVVKQNVRLEILPGTTIWSTGPGLLINGQIDALGDPANTIRFRSLSDSPWKGITLNNTTAPSILRHVEIKNADIALNAFQSQAYAHGLVLDENNWGIVAQGSDIKIENSQVRHSRKVGVSCRNTRVDLLSNNITDNESGGAQFENSPVVAKNNAIFNNGSWDIKNLDIDNKLQLDNNWWGTTNVTEVKALGEVALEPLLPSSPQNITHRSPAIIQPIPHPRTEDSQ